MINQLNNFKTTLDSPNNHIFQLLQTFSDEEIKKFNSFLNSPYFNRNKKVILLFNEIMNYFPLFNHKNLLKGKLFKTIYGVEEKGKSNLRLLYSELLHLAMTFIQFQRVQSDTSTLNIMLLHELNNRKQSSLFNLELKKIQEGAEETIDGDFFKFKYQIENEKYNNFKINDKIIKPQIPSEHISISDESDKYLTLYFLTEIISDYVNLIMHSLKYNLNINETYTKELIKSINLKQIQSAFNKDHQYLYILDIYLCLYELFEDVDNLEKYIKYKSLVEKYYNKLSSKERQFHYSKITNYLTLMDLKHPGKNEYSAYLFKIYKYILANKLYLNDKTDYLPESLYRAILLIGIRLNQLKWVKTYIQEFTPFVHPKYKKNLFVYAYSIYYFSTKEYEKSLEYVNRINFNYFIYKFDVKLLLIKIYYELTYYEEALSTIHSFKELLRTDSFFNNEVKSQYLNFIKFINLLLLHKTNSVKDLDFNLHKLKKCQNIIYKEWLLEKWGEFEKMHVPAKEANN